MSEALEGTFDIKSYNKIEAMSKSQKVKEYINNLLILNPEFSGCVEIYFKHGVPVEAKRPEKTKL